MVIIWTQLGLKNAQENGSVAGTGSGSGSGSESHTFVSIVIQNLLKYCEYKLYPPPKTPKILAVRFVSCLVRSAHRYLMTSLSLQVFYL
jgi:hypothetical protein